MGNATIAWAAAPTTGRGDVVGHFGNSGASLGRDGRQIAGIGRQRERGAGTGTIPRIGKTDKPGGDAALEVVGGAVAGHADFIHRKAAGCTARDQDGIAPHHVQHEGVAQPRAGVVIGAFDKAGKRDAEIAPVGKIISKTVLKAVGGSSACAIRFQFNAHCCARIAALEPKAEVLVTVKVFGAGKIMADPSVARTAAPTAGGCYVVSSSHNIGAGQRRDSGQGVCGISQCQRSAGTRAIPRVRETGKPARGNATSEIVQERQWGIGRGLSNKVGRADGRECHHQ